MDKIKKDTSRADLNSLNIEIRKLANMCWDYDYNAKIDDSLLKIELSTEKEEIRQSYIDSKIKITVDELSDKAIIKCQKRISSRWENEWIASKLKILLLSYYNFVNWLKFLDNLNKGSEKIYKESNNDDLPF